jgi:hypothetical protein
MNKVLAHFSRFKTEYFGVILGGVFIVTIYATQKLAPKPLSITDELKTGIQNHLVWNMKGECYFVRPTVDERIYMIRVEDCDKK